MLDYVVDMLPFIRTGGSPQKEQIGSINDDRRSTQLSEYLINEQERVFDEIQFVSGTIRQEEKDRLAKMLFRLTRGKALTFFLDFKQNGVNKSVYIVVFQEYGGTYARIQKICDSFMGERFDIPPLHKIAAEAELVGANISKSRNILETSIYQLKQYLYESNLDNDVAD